MSVFDQEIISSIFEEPTYGWGDRLKDFRAWFFSGIEVKMMILSYPTFFLAFYFILFRQDLMAAGWGWLPLALIGLSFLFFFIGVLVTSMQDWLINQYKGDCIGACEFEIIYPDLSYGGTIFNGIKAERPFAEDPRSFNLLIQDYEQRQRQLKYGSATDSEIRLNLEGKPVANFLDDPAFFSSDHGLSLKQALEEKWTIRHPDEKPKESDNPSAEAATETVEETKETEEAEETKEEKKALPSQQFFTGATKETKITGAQIEIASDAGAFMQVPHPMRAGEVIQVPRLGDFRKYVNMPIFEKYMLDTGILQPIFVKFKYAYDIGTIYTRYMIILSTDGSQSLGDLFPSPLRYIQLEGVFGKSPAYHSILCLVGVWRDIPVMLPIHTKKRTMAAFNEAQRTQVSIDPHRHDFDATGVCIAEMKIMEGGQIVKKKCHRTAQDVYMEIFSPVVPTSNEMVAVANQMELSVARFYFFTAQNLRHQLFETNVLNANLIDAGTALDDIILETEGQIAKVAEAVTQKVPRWLFWAIILILVYLAGYFRWFNLNLPFLGTGGTTPTNSTRG